MTRIPVCRITVKENRDGEYWQADCIQDGWQYTSAMAIECLEAGFAHYHDDPHRGYCYIDIMPENVSVL